MRITLAVTRPLSPTAVSLTADRLPLVIGGAGTAALLPEWPDPQAEIFARDGALFLREYRQGDCRPLSDGSTFALGNVHFRLIVARHYPGQSRPAKVQEKMFGVTVALLILLQVLTVTVLPDLLKESTLWDNQSARMLLSRRIHELTGLIRDQLRQNDPVAPAAAAVNRPDPVAQALLRQLNQEVMDMARHLRRHSDQMSRRQRSRMLADIEKVRQTVDLLVSRPPLPPLPALQLDQSVKNIIQQHQHE